MPDNLTKFYFFLNSDTIQSKKMKFANKNEKQTQALDLNSAFKWKNK